MVEFRQHWVSAGIWESHCLPLDFHTEMPTLVADFALELKMLSAFDFLHATLKILCFPLCRFLKEIFNNHWVSSEWPLSDNIILHLLTPSFWLMSSCHHSWNLSGEQVSLSSSEILAASFYHCLPIPFVWSSPALFVFLSLSHLFFP